MCKTIFEILQSLKPHSFITCGAPTKKNYIGMYSKSKLFSSKLC